MAKITFKGLEEYELRLSRMGKETTRIAGAAIYEGAAIVADEIKKGIRGLPVVTGSGPKQTHCQEALPRPRNKAFWMGLALPPCRTKTGI